MTQVLTLTHQFVEFIPDKLADGTIYISVKYATAAHMCCCGCGQEVVTPIAPTGWSLTFDGKTISLNPSIGNWSYPCKSHYWIIRNRVQWAEKWSKERIQAGRAHDALAKERYFGSTKTTTVHDKNASVGPERVKSDGTYWSKLKKWWPF